MAGARVTDLKHRRARGDAETLIAELYWHLEAFEDCRFDLEGIAWEIGRIGARLGVMASKGHLREVAA